MKCNFLLIILLITGGQLFAQEKANPPCIYGNVTFVKAEYAPTYGNDPLDLQKYFDSTFNNIKKSNTKISLTLIVDTVGKASVSDVNYYGGPSLVDEAGFKKIINAMPNWTPGRQKNCNVKTAVAILLTFDKKSVQVFYHKSQSSAN